MNIRKNCNNQVWIETLRGTEFPSRTTLCLNHKHGIAQLNTGEKYTPHVTLAVGDLHQWRWGDYVIAIKRVAKTDREEKIIPLSEWRKVQRATL